MLSIGRPRDCGWVCENSAAANFGRRLLPRGGRGRGSSALYVPLLSRYLRSLCSLMCCCSWSSGGEDVVWGYEFPGSGELHAVEDPFRRDYEVPR